MVPTATTSSGDAKKTRFSVTEFSEVRAKGEKITGVTMATDEPLVMVKKQAPNGPIMVPVHGGFELTGFFSPIRLIELSLVLRLTHEGYKELYAAFGTEVRITSGSLPDGKVHFTGNLRLPDEKVAELAKSLAPTADHTEQLLDIMRRNASLLNELDEWQFRGGRPFEAAD
jgi:hypothetical protein